MEQIYALVNEMSPYLLLGFLFAGIMHVFIPSVVYSRYLSGHNFRSVFYAALFGVPLPLCSCGVLPTAMGLRKEGASKGATISFLIATPETGVDSIAATYSLMGLPFAIVRPVMAFFTSLLAGSVVNTFDKDDTTPVMNNETEESHCHCHHNTDMKELSFVDKIKEALRYAFIDMMEDIGKWLVVGLVVAALITIYVPDEFFEVFKNNTLLSMLLVLCIAIPMYICATGSIPIAVALIMKGLTPGAALVLLMAGPACNVASLLVINKFLGRRTLLLYLCSIILGAIAAGFIIDQLPTEWFLPTLMKTADCHEAEGYSWFNVICTIILAVLLLNALYRHYIKGQDCCHCHDGEPDHCCCHKEDDKSSDKDGCHEHQEEQHACCCHNK